MSNIKNTIIALVLAWTMTSCFYDRIDLDLNAENPKLAVEAWITDLDEPQYIELSRTVNYLGEQEIDHVTDAIVTLNDEVEDIQLVQQEDGKYYLSDDWQPRLGNYYTLTILLDGETYTAREQMRVCPQIENPFAEIADFESIFDDETYDEDTYRITFSFQDSLGLGDGYYLVDYLKGSLAGDSISNGDTTHDRFFDGEYQLDVSVTSSDRPFFLHDEAVLEIYSISKEATLFIYDLEAEAFGDVDPFAGPPANLRTNISNGAVGYFMIGGAHRVIVPVEESEEDTTL
ncbi:DUF4249 domain-containing protein [Reichenbachiella sp. MSK19-1]|uniref:DUF4249 domain-containing protein n=1 Tax=Reichenbachiella sp. MSK19-1 TaxID=1897631 RepID=UPI000E6BB5D7|nr:DUF4249 domain-containing protein [Reichenbachiella sp. MSK19-1]RJE74471.1 hypothetical protein BGP76_15055 [Reichenbachiella sp. MSK19-1]